MPQLFQPPLRGDVGAWMTWVGLVPEQDNGDFVTSRDRRDFDAWRGLATTN